jgi:NAD(P)-dependent dehydrogenase (short-subunit alcohol dehydrogenase family)
LDVIDAPGCAAFIEQAEGEFRDTGGVYGVFANAGYGLERSVMETSDADLRAIMETNVYGSLNVIRPAVALMRARERPTREPRGHVLWCSSCLARVTLPFYGAYSASKAVQAHLGRAMRLELEPEGIIVSTVHPITTKTEFFDATKVRSGRGTVAEHSPDWFAQPAEVVAERVVACLRRPRAEVWTGAKGAFVRFGMSVMTMLPWVADACTRGMVGARSGKVAE